MVWQPIETAPKSIYPHRVLLFDSGVVTIGYWMDDIPDDDIGPGLKASWRDFGGFELKPTHWMPMPEPPHDAALY
jgi:hypothetical protein